MSTYAQILFYAIPFFLVLIAIEWFFSRNQNKTVYRTFDTVSSLSSGITNSVKDVLGLSIVIISYTWLFDNIKLLDIQSTWLTYAIAFVALDFAGYWSHRFEHKVNILWNRHVIHHSSEEFNLACALRQPISSVFAIFTILLLPAALLGVSPKVIATVAPLHLFAQFWYHTRLINKMGWLENIIVTPAHHRVHHAINDLYIDKNFGQIFIVWDKWFGTFQEEIEDIEPVYGVKNQLSTWNPILINWKHMVQIFKDAWRTHSIMDKIKIWFMPTGWRPTDVLKKYPISTMIEASSQVKYSTRPSLSFNVWAAVQLIITLLLTLHFFSVIDKYSLIMLIAYGGFVVLNIYSYTSLMDRDKVSIISEVVKYITIAVIFNSIGNWYGLPIISILLYNSISLFGAIYFLYVENQPPLKNHLKN